MVERVRSRGAYNLDRVKLLNVNIAGPKSIFIGAAKSHYRFAVCGPNIDGNVNIVAAKAAPALNAPKSLHIETSMLIPNFAFTNLYHEYLLLLFIKFLNKLAKINEARGQLPNGTIGYKYPESEFCIYKLLICINIYCSNGNYNCETP